MSTVIRGGEIAADPYQALDESAALPVSGHVLLSLARWTAEKEALSASQLSIGVRLPNTVDPLTLDSALLHLPLLALEFPGFADGRAYSQAQLLRGRLGYRGELRAVGAAVVLDQVAGMLRCGFDSFALRADQDPQQVLALIQRTPQQLRYQTAVDSPSSVLRSRRTA